MIGLAVSIERDDALKFLGALESQIPYATSVAINNTLNDVQAAERTHVRETFTLRRQQFVERTIYIGPQDRARKDRPEGTVRIDPRRDFLAKFEDQTIKRPRSAESLGVPVFRQDNPGLIIGRGSSYSIRKLMDAIRSGGPAHLGSDRGGALKFHRRKGAPKRLAGLNVFLVNSKRGTLIEERVGDVRRVLYVFRKSVPISPDLRFGEIALPVAIHVWPEHAAKAIAHAIETAR